MIKRYLQFIKEEINPKKLSLIKSDDISNLFTASIEIELEMITDLKKELDNYSREYLENTLIDRIRKSIQKELSNLVNYNNTEDNQEFLEYCLNFILENDVDDDVIEDFVDEEKAFLKISVNKVERKIERINHFWDLNPSIKFSKLGREDEYQKLTKKLKGLNDKIIILEIFNNISLAYFMGDNFESVERKFRKKFPTFYQKWGEMFKFEVDISLNRGIELSNKTYFNGINELIECVHDFYQDYDLSPNVIDYKFKKVKGSEIKDVKYDRHFSFKKSTGIHINLGLKDKSIPLNPIKGVILIDDLQKDENDVPYIFRNNIKRINSKFNGSLKPVLLNQNNLIERSLSLLKENKISEMEKLLNDNIMKILKNEPPYDQYKFVYKNFGLNLLPLEKYKYIEFRYSGHKIEEEALEENIYYYAYIMWSMANPEIDREEYLKKLYKFLTSDTIPPIKEYTK